MSQLVAKGPRGSVGGSAAGEADSTSVGEAERCLNCSQALFGAYCSRCGQAAQSPIKPIRDFLQESLSEVASLDGGQLRSLRLLLTRPGSLTVEYLEGRRTDFVHPVRLFLQVGVAAYLLTRLLPTQSALFGVGPELFGDESSVSEVVFAGAIIPIGALSHWLALRRRRTMLLEHFVFVLHIVAFSFVLAPLEGFLYVLADGRPLLESATAVMPLIVWGFYWVLALGRPNDQSWRRAVGDAFRVYVAALLLTLPFFLYQTLLNP